MRRPLATTVRRAGRTPPPRGRRCADPRTRRQSFQTGRGRPTVNYIEWVDQVRQLLDAQWHRDPAPFALDVVRTLPAMQANTRTFDDRRAADPFMCASEDLIALGVLRLD